MNFDFLPFLDFIIAAALRNKINIMLYSFSFLFHLLRRCKDKLSHSPTLSLTQSRALANLLAKFRSYNSPLYSLRMRSERRKKMCTIIKFSCSRFFNDLLDCLLRRRKNSIKFSCWLIGDLNYRRRGKCQNDWHKKRFSELSKNRFSESY